MLNLEVIEVTDAIDDIEENEWKILMTRTHETEWSLASKSHKNAECKWLFDSLKRLFGSSKVAFLPPQMAFSFFDRSAIRLKNIRFFVRKFRNVARATFKAALKKLYS